MMIKEKQTAFAKDKLDLFVEKWKLFVSICDLMGPDCQIMFLLSYLQSACLSSHVPATISLDGCRVEWLVPG